MGLTVPDASVLIAALDGGDLHHDAARRALEEEWDSPGRIVIPIAAYAETMERPLALGGDPVARADAFFRTQCVEVIAAA